MQLMYGLVFLLSDSIVLNGTLRTARPLKGSEDHCMAKHGKAPDVVKGQPNHSHH